MKISDIIAFLETRGSSKNVQGMARFGIKPSIMVLGVSLPIMRKLAKKIGKNHVLAQQLWKSEIHEARILAVFVEDPSVISEQQMDDWASDFETWDLCDTACGSLFDKTPFAFKKVKQWMKSNDEFVRRASFALLAWLAVHDKNAMNDKFVKFFPLMKKYATDDRKYVCKAVNWALRQIGKRNSALRLKAIALAEEISKLDSRTARWIAVDAIRELRNPKIVAMVAKK
jgi:3-methyladenine DNA glycosylase AlkD